MGTSTPPPAPDPSLATVRSFNRTVTETVGALSDRYLARDRPIGEARVLWEVGADGAEVSAVRARLALDSGYLSRLLRSLEAAGLVEVGPSAGDQRQRRATLTPAGLDELAELDRRSDEFASSLLEPLGPGQREKLTNAMATVTRLLTAAAVRIEVVDPDDPRARFCVREYFAEINSRFDVGFDPAGSLPTHADAMRAPKGLFLLATLHGDPVGCGALKFLPDGVAEVKRVWLSSAVRGFGLGRRLLGELERRAAGASCRVIHLDTNRSLTEAIGLYRSAGYAEVPAFNDEPYAHFWFEKVLEPVSGDAATEQKAAL